MKDIENLYLQEVNGLRDELAKLREELAKEKKLYNNLYEILLISEDSLVAEQSSHAETKKELEKLKTHFKTHEDMLIDYTAGFDRVNKSLEAECTSHALTKEKLAIRERALEMAMEKIPEETYELTLDWTGLKNYFINLATSELAEKEEE